MWWETFIYTQNSQKDRKVQCDLSLKLKEQGLSNPLVAEGLNEKPDEQQSEWALLSAFNWHVPCSLHR